MRQCWPCTRGLVRVTLEHVLAQHKVLAPDVDNVVCEGGAGRAIVVETGNTAVDVKGGGVEESSLWASI
jgi:hypothetical protein